MGGSGGTSSGSSAGIAPNGGATSASASTAGTVNTLVPLSAVTKLTPGTMPLAVNHLGQLPAITISFNLTKGYALSDAVAAITKTRDEIGIPQTVLGQFQGQAQAFQSSMGNMGLLL